MLYYNSNTGEAEKLEKELEVLLIDEVLGVPSYMLSAKAEDYYMDFEVFRVLSWNNDSTHQGELFLSGGIKWDGCSHLYFGEKDDTGSKTDGYLHLCGIDGMQELREVLKKVYEVASQRIKYWDEGEVV